jgi:protein TorT
MKLPARLILVALMTAVPALLAAHASADDEFHWWPRQVDDLTSGEAVTIDYVPLERASKKWHICILFPHLKDTSWVIQNSGIMREAARLGVKATLFQAGGYTELNKQLSQFDDCISLGVDAIVIAPISEGGLRLKIEEAAAKGIVQVGLTNPIRDAPVDAAVFADYDIDSEVAGRALVKYFESQGKATANVVDFAGVPGSGWAEDAASGWERAFEGTGVTILEHKYGETGKSAQLKLVEDAIQAWDDVDAFVGVGVMAEVAPDVLEETGLSDQIVVAAWHLTEGVLRGIENGTILGASAGPQAVEPAIALDMAVRILEGQTVPKRIREIPTWITKDYMENEDMSPFVPPEGWKVQYTVE